MMTFVCFIWEYFLRLGFMLILVGNTASIFSQNVLKTFNQLPVEELVTDVFIRGNCKNVSNITSLGNPNLSIGQFKNGKEILGIEDGIILSTGDISLAEGPNVSLDATFSFNNESMDPDLDLLATDNIFDLTGIEFDFVPIDNTVSFRYVFASEEYCEFVGTSFNDVFGFFVSGPGINGSFENNAINVATIEGTDTNVSINNVNHLINEGFYVNNATTDDVQNCSLDYNDEFQDFIEYDGFTVALRASFDVIPCETYHIRLVIGDVGDPILDSAVFLESKSFDLGEKVTVRAEVPNREEPIAYESCIDGQIVFTRSDLQGLNQACTVEYIIDPLSQALNGIDFEEIPLSITIPAGDTSFILPINVINDLLTEGPESFKLLLQYPCDCLDPGLSELTITEPPGLSTSNDSIAVCANQTFYVVPKINSGVAPFEYAWDNGALTDSIELTVTEPTRHMVTITDFCGDIDTVSIDIEIQSNPTASISGMYSTCDTANINIPIVLEGNPPWSLTYAIDGIEQETIDGIETSPYMLITSQEGSYNLTAFSDAYCDGIPSGFAEVVSPLQIIVEIVPPTCFNTADGSIVITSLEAKEPITIDWDNNSMDEYLLDDLKVGTYTLAITDGDGCTLNRVFELIESSQDIRDCIPIYIPNVFSPISDGVNEVFSIFFGPNSGVKEITSFMVYSRWGVLVYENSNVLPEDLVGWDGNFNGQALDSNVFVYLVVLTLEDDTILNYYGDVTLVK